MRNFTRFAVLAAAVASSVATSSETTGNDGNFQFSYPADDRILDFNKPIAIGARLDLEVVTVGDELPVELVTASTDDASVIDVVDFSGNSVTVTATGEGGIVLTVKGDVEGEDDALSDSVNLLARTPEVHVLRHTCENFNGIEASEYAYLAGQQDVYVPFEFEMENSQPIIGYGYYPVRASSNGAVLDIEHQGAQYMRFDLGDPGLVTLESEIDGTTLDLHVTAASDIDGVVQPIAFVLEDIDVGDTNWFYALPSAAGRPVCQANTAFEVQSLTPDICAVSDGDNPAAGDPGKEFGWFTVEGVSAGTCEYVVTYPQGMGGAGASQTFTFEIEP